MIKENRPDRYRANQKTIKPTLVVQIPFFKFIKGFSTM